MPVEGKVAQIPDQRSVVVNIGSEQGVKKSDVYKIYQVGDPVIDPDTGEDLGSIRYTKATVVPRKIMPRKTIMESKDMTTISPVGLGMFSGSTKRKKLTTDSSVKNNSNEVEVGDSVIIADSENSDDQNS